MVFRDWTGFPLSLLIDRRAHVHGPPCEHDAKTSNLEGQETRKFCVSSADNDFEGVHTPHRATWSKVAKAVDVWHRAAKLGSMAGGQFHWATCWGERWPTVLMASAKGKPWARHYDSSNQIGRLLQLLWSEPLGLTSKSTVSQLGSTPNMLHCSWGWASSSRKPLAKKPGLQDASGQD